jgi:phospholipase/carboxylesterase
MLERVTKEPSAPATHAIIWLHGLGADGHDFEPIVPQLQLTTAHIRFIFPHAPVRPVSLFNGMPARAWFDLSAKKMGAEYSFVEAEIKSMAQRVEGLINEQIAQGIAAERILLAGFSQGGAMATYIALTASHRLGGLIGLSTFLPIAGQLISANTPRMPVFMGHGTVDDIVPITLGKQLADTLTQADFAVDWHSYGMAHSVNDAEVRDLRKWLVENCK